MTRPRIRGQVASGRSWSCPGQVYGALPRGRLAGQGVRKYADHNRLLPAHESIGPLARVPVGVISHSVAVMRRTPSPWSGRLENAIFSVKRADARPLGCRFASRGLRHTSLATPPARRACSAGPCAGRRAFTGAAPWSCEGMVWQRKRHRAAAFASILAGACGTGFALIA